MQRGTVVADRSGPYSPILGIKPVIRNQELLHFGIGDEGRATYIERLRPLIRGFAKAGFRKPRDVCRLLNKSNIKTFAGHNWDPRLVALLLGYMFEKTPAAPSMRQRHASSKPIPGAGAPVLDHEREQGTRLQAPLTRQEVERRMAALSTAHEGNAE